MKRKQYTTLCLLLTVIFISCCDFNHKEGEPDVINSLKLNRDEIITVVANRNKIENKEEFAKLLIKKCKDNSFRSVKFSTDYGYATSLEIMVYRWKDEIEGKDPVMRVEYKSYEWNEDYNIVHDSDKFQLYVDGKRIKIR